MTSWLHDERLAAVLQEVRACAAETVLDLGCGDGACLFPLIDLPGMRQIYGIDLSHAALERLRGRLERMTLPEMLEVIVTQASMTEARNLPKGYDCAVLVETIEHLEPAQLSALERAVFGAARPGSVIVTTPNAEFNHLLGVPSHRFRHPDHRFEWPRARFAQWADGVASRNGYTLRLRHIGGAHPDFGGASQMAVFARS